VPEHKVITVSSVGELQQQTASYAGQGYTVLTQSASTVTMVKRKTINWLWVVLGVWCVIPLIIYLIVYSKEQDAVVEIRLTSGGAPDVVLRQPAPGQAATPPGATGEPVDHQSASGGGVLPPPADPVRPQASADGKMWWNGTEWLPI
jgi:hypothetical protein